MHHQHDHTTANSCFPSNQHLTDRSRLAITSTSGNYSRTDTPLTSKTTPMAPVTDRPKVSSSGYDITRMPAAVIQERAKALTPLQRNVALNSGTEVAFTGVTVDGSPHDNKRRGVYVGSISDLPLFSSDHKFDSGTGWPSFYQPIDPLHVIEERDTSIPFMPRVEVLDARSGAHLGHVFNDGPPPTGRDIV
eukprot:jgi/Picre1/33261/NNA_008585.t1